MKKTKPITALCQFQMSGTGVEAAQPLKPNITPQKREKPHPNPAEQ
jgi:hypothetical protein